MRGSFALVAVLVVVALVTGILIGGRLLQDWNGFRKPVPATQTHATLAELEGRALQLPHLAATAACPDGPKNAAGVYGRGPFYGDSTAAQGPYRTNWGLYWDLEGETDRSVTGLMLVRAVDMKTGQPYVFAGPYATGSVVGTDTVHGQAVTQYTEAVLDASHRAPGTSQGKAIWPFMLGVPKGNSGCYGWQVDGDNFTETFVFDAGIT